MYTYAVCGLLTHTCSALRLPALECAMNSVAAYGLAWWSMLMSTAAPLAKALGHNAGPKLHHAGSARPCSRAPLLCCTMRVCSAYLPVGAWADPQVHPLIGLLAASHPCCSESAHPMQTLLYILPRTLT